MKPAASKPECRIVPLQETYVGKQGHTYYAGISHQSTGSQNICMHLLVLPPGEHGRAHMHEDHETAIYIISGEAQMWYGENLSQYLRIKAGEFLYIPAGVPHLPGNPSATTACHAVISRTDPNEQESVVLLPELEQYVQIPKP